MNVHNSHNAIQYVQLPPSKYIAVQTYINEIKMNTIDRTVIEKRKKYK